MPAARGLRVACPRFAGLAVGAHVGRLRSPLGLGRLRSRALGSEPGPGDSGPRLGTRTRDQDSGPGRLGLFHSKAIGLFEGPGKAQSCSKTQGCDGQGAVTCRLSGPSGLPSIVQLPQIFCGASGILFALCSNIGKNTAARKGRRSHADPVRATPGWMPRLICQADLSNGSR